MSQIFITHTRKDKDFLNKFDSIFAGTEVKRYRSEFEEIQEPPWRTIKQEINRSNALFFIVGKELVQSHKNHDSDWDYTQNWIAYEIGLACQIGLDVWVICDKNINLNFSVPYVSMYWPNFDADQYYKPMSGIIGMYNNKVKLPCPLPTSLMDKECDIGVKCSNKGCGLEFNMLSALSKNQTISCPHCLKSITFLNGFPNYHKSKKAETLSRT